jgi:hypothetical protein
MSNMTPREILDAIRQGLEETRRRIDDRKADRARRPVEPEARPPTNPAMNKDADPPR